MPSDKLPNVYTPEFIPYYPDIQKQYNLNEFQTVIYGFVRFYTSSTKNSFYFSNAQLGKLFDKSTYTVSRTVLELIKKGAVTVDREINNRRYLSVAIRNNAEPLYAKMRIPYTQECVTNNNSNNNINNISKDITPKGGYGNGNINQLIEHMKQTLEIPNLAGTIRDNRFACSNLLKQVQKEGNTSIEMAVENVMKLISLIPYSKFWNGKINSFPMLYRKRVDLLQDFKTRTGGSIDATDVQ